jgi:peptidoglycan/LPS O-acetylase OafA/YrhL
MGQTTQSNNSRVQGVDSIRFICGLFVVVFHFELIPPTVFGTGTFASIARGVMGSLFDGPAALIVFFVISGFGIHFASPRDLTVNAPSFWSRRLIRAGGPALIALALWIWAGVRLTPEEPGPFWSLICEIEYYLLYPLLLLLRRRFGWWPLILVTQVLAYVLAFTHLPNIEKYVGGYPAFGFWNWVMGLPCFLVGCWLAESYGRFPAISARGIWLVRGFIYGISVLFQGLRFHGGSVYVSNAFTLNIFAMFVAFWLGLEIAYRREKPAPRILEWAGNWTYSLYLVHPAVPGLIVKLGLSPFFATATGLLVTLTSILIAYPFHLGIEAPFYRLAIAVSNRLKSKKSIRPSPALAVPDS